MKTFDVLWLKVSKETFHFKVQACEQAYIVLAQTVYFKDENSAEIVIGANGNMETRVIPDRTKPSEYQTEATRNILDCNSMREFWISWENKEICVGYGQPYEEEIMSVPYNIDEIVGISLSTSNAGKGTWEIAKHEGESLISKIMENRSLAPSGGGT